MAPDVLGNGGDDSGDDLSEIKINEPYAKKFEYEERQKAIRRLDELKKKGLVSDDSDESESSEEEDASDPQATRSADLEMLKTLALLKKNDPKIYDKNVQFYEPSSGGDGGSNGDEDDGVKSKARTKEKALYLKDVNAKNLLENGLESDDEDDVNYDMRVYDDKQKEGLKAFLEAEKAAGGDEDNDDADVFQEKRRPASLEDGADKEEIEEVEKRVKEVWNEEGLDEDEKFLKDYISNVLKGIIKLDGWRKESLDEVHELSEEEEELEKQDAFESKYNYRFEEAEAAGAGGSVVDRVLGHSRTVEGSVRKKESSRKRQRKSKEERMAKAERERQEEVKHLKNVMKKEIQEKLHKVRLAAGIAEEKACKLMADDLEEDFNPEEFDKKMGEMFGDDYYDAEDPDPDFGSGDEFNLDDFDPNAVGPQKDLVTEENQADDNEAGNEGRKKRRKKRKTTTEEQELNKAVDDYYKLDYEDTIGDMKTRFKYKSVVPNRYGLSAADILTVDDKSLNQYVSLKKLAPYREKEWKVMHRKTQKDMILYGGKDKKKDGKKSRATSVLTPSVPEEEATEPKEQGDKTGEVKSSRSTRRNLRNKELKLSDSRLEAYGKKHSKH